MPRSEECIAQHKLLVCDFVVSAKLLLKDTVVQKEFEMPTDSCRSEERFGIYQKWTS